MSSNFFKLSPRLQRGIAHTLGWSSLWPVQELTIDAVFAGHNCVVLAPTAGGKTEAAFFPILDIIYRQQLLPVAALYVSPLRALLNNQEPRLMRLAGLVGLEAFKWHGDVGPAARRHFLDDPTHVLMITPESLEVMLISPRIDTSQLFRELSFAVVDEVHAFAGDDRGAHLMAVLERLQILSRHDIQRVGLSATVGDPEEIARWLCGSSRRPHVVINPPRPPQERLIEVDYLSGDQTLGEAAAPYAAGRKALFFVQARADAEEVHQELERAGITAHVHHSSVSRDLREEAELQFTYRGPSCIVCTSTMELGIDVGDLDIILQHDAPGTVSSFMQRLGRTGRRTGTRPHIAFFATDDQSLLLATALINLARRGWVEPVTPSPRAVHILVHQILAQALQHYGITRQRAWEAVRQAAPFARITQGEYDRLVDHLVATDILQSVGGLLTIGETGEERFGRRNFLEMYSVFETPREVTVVTIDRREIGTLETWFVQALGDEPFVFVLSGRRWQTVELDLEQALLIVRPAPAGRIPRWAGGMVLLSRQVAEEHRAILLSDGEYPFLHRPARQRLRELRQQHRDLLRQEALPMQQEGGKRVLYTFAGGRINALLARALAYLLDARVTNDNFAVSVEGRRQAPLTRDDVLSALRSLADPSFFDVRRLKELMASLPRGRFSKFQPLLPPEMEAQFLVELLFDPKGLQEVLRSRMSD